MLVVMLILFCHPCRHRSKVSSAPNLSFHRGNAPELSNPFTCEGIRGGMSLASRRWFSCLCFYILAIITLPKRSKHSFQ
jgi:hypothetical protein